MNALRNNVPTEHLVGCMPLAIGDTLRIEDPSSLLMYVAQGDVWITEDGAQDDVFVAARDWRRLTRPGTTVVEALSPAVLLLTSPQAERFARAIAVSPRPALRTRPPRSRIRVAALRAWCRRAWTRWTRAARAGVAHAS